MLSQAKVTDSTDTLHTWLDATQLGLKGILESEWESFVQVLRCGGLLLNSESDKLMWSWNRSTSKVIANLAYQSILYSNNVIEGKWWHKAIWTVKIPTKLICFMWLCLEDCILIGLNFQKRGGIGPTACTLCLKDEESVTHLFINCQSTQRIWNKAFTALRIDFVWQYPTIEENLKKWFFTLPNSRHIPFLIMWDVWKYRNKVLFENWNRNDP